MRKYIEYEVSRTAEPAYSYIVYNRYSAVIEKNLAPTVYKSLLFYPSCNKLLV